MKKVFILSNAFVGMVAAVIEGYKSEVGGLLFGDSYQDNRKIVIEQAIPLQTTKRRPTEVHFHPRRTKRVLRIWDNLSPYWYLGSFHSHPEYGGKKYSPEPSNEDEKSMMKGELEVITSIWKAERHLPLGYYRDGSRLSGAVGDYYIKIASWFCSSSEKSEEAEVWCPYIEVINLGYEMGIVSKWGRLFEKDSIVPETKLRTLRRKIRKYESQVVRSPDNYYSALEPVRRILKDIQKG